MDCLFCIALPPWRSCHITAALLSLGPLSCLEGRISHTSVGFRPALRGSSLEAFTSCANRSLGGRCAASSLHGSALSGFRSACCLSYARISVCLLPVLGICRSSCSYGGQSVGSGRSCSVISSACSSCTVSSWCSGIPASCSVSFSGFLFRCSKICLIHHIPYLEEQKSCSQNGNDQKNH